MKKAYFIILMVLFIFLLALSFLNGLVLFSEPKEPIPPDFIGVVYRLIVFIIWFFISALIAKQLSSKEGIILLSIGSLILSFCHIAGGYYLIHFSINSIIKNDRLFYPTLEFIFGIVNGIHILLFILGLKVKS